MGGMRGLVLSLGAHGVADMLASPVALATWEVARRRARAVTAAEVGRILAVDTHSVQRGLDWLEEFGLLERLPIRANRRLPAYRTTTESFVVVFDPADSASQARIERAVAAARDHVSRQLARCAAVEHDGMDPWAVRRHCSVQLEGEDLEEFRRLMAEVTGFLDAAQARVRKVGPPAAGSVNVHLSMEAASAAGPALPVPPVRFVPNSERERLEGDAPMRGIWALSPREREIAMLMAGGRNRPAIARTLGISINTVSTLSKRIYAKLGVHGRAELSNRIRRRA